jgi:sulfur relay (sulfurtransferase) complex TusBCD TusD component (DsrE family)
MEKRFTFVLTASPYSGETAATVLKLASAVLDAGHRPAIFATADGAYGFVKGQAPAGVIDVGAAAEAFLTRGGEVHL